MKLPLRIAHGVLAALFALSLALQFNDPNPWPWVAVYGVSAVVAGLAAAGRPPRKLAWAVVAVCAAWEIHYLRVGAEHVPFGSLVQDWHMTDQTVVDGREFYALMLMAGWMLVVALAGKPRAQVAVD